MPRLLDKVAASFGYSPVSPWKAETGVGAFMMRNDPPLSSITGNQQQKMKEAQNIAQQNRWVRAAERVISTNFGTVDWHLEDINDEEVTDESAEPLRAVRDLLEKPYTPLPNDPINATPRTRSGLWGLTSRHMGVCGVSTWYLDQTQALNGFPLQILYINPARLTPAGTDRRLVGWVLDADNRGGGTPLEANKVLVFTLEEPDDGFFPPGLVETAMSSVNITRYGDRHAAAQFASGGKLPGVYSPKADAGVMPPDVFQQLEKALREANMDPDATRRSIILRGPIDFTPTAATPEQLDLVAVQNMARDDILGLWGVPLSQLGIAAPAGLNSGNTKSYDEAALWQKAISPRLRRFYEVIQFQFLDPLGMGLELEIEEPTFDDDLPKFDLAIKAQNIPLRNWERRALIGYEPFGDDLLDNAVVLPDNIVTFAQAPDPDALSVATTPLDEAKAKINVRAHAESLTPKIKQAVADFLATQKREIVAQVRKNAAHILAKPSDEAAWWKGDRWDRALIAVLTPFATDIANATAKDTSAKLGRRKADLAPFTDLVGNRALQAILANVGTRITGINETTRQSVAATIKSGIEQGLGAADLGDMVEQDDEAFGEYRSELIARTETTSVLNTSQIESYREFDVTQVRAIDGDGDEECAARDGQTFDLDEALSIEDHPNGTLDWEPIVG